MNFTVEVEVASLLAQQIGNASPLSLSCPYPKVSPVHMTLSSVIDLPLTAAV